MDNTINLQLNFDGKEANAAIKLTNDNIKELYNSFKYGKLEADGLISSISRGFNNAREIIQGFKEVYSALDSTIGSTIREFQASETANFRLASSLQQAGTYTSQTYQSLLNYAAQLQQTTVYSNEQYISLMAQYQAMGLTTEQTKDAALQTANLAALMGGDFNSAAEVMKDLFNGNADSISKYVSGIDETAVKSGNLDQIMQELNGHIGGQAEAFANTSAGAVAQMNNSFKDLQENIGVVISNGLGPFINGITSIISSLNSLYPQATGIIGTIGLFSASLAALRVTGLFPAFGSITALQASLQTAQVQFRLAAMGGQVFAGSMTAIGTSVKGFFAALGPGGWIILGISALATAVSLLSGKTDELSESEKEAVNGADAEKIKFSLLTQTILDQNASIEARNRAKKEAQEMYPGFLSNLSIENTKHSDLAAAINKETQAYNKLLEVKVLEKQLDLAMNELAAARNESGKPGFFDYVLGALQSGPYGQGNAVAAAQTNAAVNKADKVWEAQKKVNELSEKLQKAKGDTDNKTGGGLSEEEKRKAFNDQKTILDETQRHEEEMLKLETHTNVQALELKKKYFEQMIALSKRFGQDATSLVNQRIETEAKLEKEYAKEKEKKEKKEKEEAEKKKAAAELAATEPLPAEKSSKAITDVSKKTMRTVEVDDKKHQKNMQDSAEQTTDKKLKLLWEEKEAVADGLGQTSQMFAKHTAAYQAFASAQALIDTYTSAESAYKAMVGIPFVGPALAVGAAAAAIVAGMEQVAQINSIAVPSAPGYALGGRLKQGEAGYIEGWHNEIIAPEKTFVDLFRTELRPQIYNGMGSDNSALLMEMRKLNSSFEGYSNRPIAITKDAVGKIVSKGNSQLRKSRV